MIVIWSKMGTDFVPRYLQKYRVLEGPKGLKWKVIKWRVTNSTLSHQVLTKHTTFSFIRLLFLRTRCWVRISRDRLQTSVVRSPGRTDSRPLHSSRDPCPTPSVSPSSRWSRSPSSFLSTINFLHNCSSYASISHWSNTRLWRWEACKREQKNGQ